MQTFKFQIVTNIETTKTYRHEVEAESYGEAEKIMKENVKNYNFINENSFTECLFNPEEETEDEENAMLYFIDNKTRQSKNIKID